MEELKGETVGVYVAGNIANAWRKAAAAADQSVAKWGARAIEMRLEAEGLMPHQRTKTEELMDLAAQAAAKDFEGARAALIERIRDAEPQAVG